MSLLIVAPELLDSAATDLGTIGSALTAAHVSAAVPTTGLVAAGADEVSVAVAALFSGHGQQVQALGARAAAFHTQFVLSLTAGAGAYASTEAANVEQTLLSAAQQVQQQTQPFWQALLGVVNAPTEHLLGRPLIGNGTNGTTSTQ